MSDKNTAEVDALRERIRVLDGRLEVFDQLEAYGCTSAAHWLDAVSRIKALEDALQRLSDALHPDDGKWPNTPAHSGVRATFTRKQYNAFRRAHKNARALLAPPISEAHGHLLTNPD